MIAFVHSIYSQSVHAGLMDNDAEQYCTIPKLIILKLCAISLSYTAETQYPYLYSTTSLHIMLLIAFRIVYVVSFKVSVV